MGSQRFFQCLLVAGTLLAMLGILLFFKQGSFPFMSMSHHARLVAQNVNEYKGPTHKLPGNPQRIRVQILINDDPNPQGVQIESVEFNGQPITLKPRDIYGFRGQGSFQTAPGKYKLKWTVRRDRIVWPRTISHEEEVDLDPRDLWIQITITGETASIS